MVFPVYNVNFRKTHTNSILVSGEVVNESAKRYAVAMFKILLFDRYHLLGSGIIKVNNFHPKAIRGFEVSIEDLSSKLIPSIARYEVLFEGGY